MNAAEYDAFVDRVREHPAPCKHGHIDCSDREGGPCCDEEWPGEDDEPSGECTDPAGHKWIYTGTAYGGDDPSYHGEGRCYCAHCGADGDG